MKKILPIIILIIFAAFGAYLAKDQLLGKNPQQEQKAQTQQAVAQLAGTTLYVTEEGQVTDTTSKEVPQLFLTQEASASAGTKITDRSALFAIKLAALVVKTDFRAASIRLLDANSVAVYDTKETVAIFSPNKSLEEQVDSLQQVIGKARIGDDKIAKIDLRYQNPVVSTK